MQTGESTEVGKLHLKVVVTNLESMLATARRAETALDEAIAALNILKSEKAEFDVCKDDKGAAKSNTSHPVVLSAEPVTKFEFAERISGTDLLKIHVTEFRSVGPPITTFAVKRSFVPSPKSEPPVLSVSIPHVLTPKEKQILSDLLVGIAQRSLLG